MNVYVPLGWSLCGALFGEAAPAAPFFGRERKGTEKKNRKARAKEQGSLSEEALRILSTGMEKQTNKQANRQTNNNTHTHTHTHTHAHAHTHTHTRTHAHTHVRTLACTHARMQLLVNLWSSLLYLKNIYLNFFLKIDVSSCGNTAVSADILTKTASS